VGIWIIVCIQEPSNHFLHTFVHYAIVFRDSSPYQKKLSLFCMLCAMANQRMHWPHLTTLPISVAW